MTQSFHLSDEQLHDLAEGLVDQGAAEDRLAHLDECPECAQRFEHSLDDGNTLVGLARESLQQADPYQNEAGFKRGYGVGRRARLRACSPKRFTYVN